MRSFRFLPLFGVAFLWALLAHAEPPHGQYPDHAQSTQTTTTVNIVWLHSFQAVNAVCSFLMESDGIIVGCYNFPTHTIYVVEPENFNDSFRLEILGHEFWHALGAQHPAL